jgi:hypothetical protein
VKYLVEDTTSGNAGLLPVYLGGNLAIYGSCLRIMQYLLSRGLNPDPSTMVEVPLLFTAITETNESIVEQLLEAGANLNIIFDGVSVIYKAATTKNYKIMSLLVHQEDVLYAQRKDLPGFDLNHYLKLVWDPFPQSCMIY